MLRECIICREIKSDFNEEHVFPKTIGGGFKIYSVCSECNKRMGDLIDTPFVNLKQILLFRHNYGLQRGQRKIKNPLSGKHITNEGETVIIRNNGNGFYYDIVPQMQIIESENGPVGKITVTGGLISSKENLIEKYSKEFEKRTGYKVGFHSVEENQKSQPVTITVTDSNNDFILGCLKIAYESAVTLIPQYYEDELATTYSKMLKSGKINKEYQHHINPQKLVINDLIDKLNSYSAIANYHCAVILSNLESIGLIAIVKVFDMVYCLILSKKNIYLDDRIILLLNDSINEAVVCSIIKKISTFQVHFNTSSFTSEHWKDIDDNRNEEEKLFTNENGNIPVFNDKKEMIVTHLSILQDAGKWSTDFSLLPTIKRYNLTLPNGLFLKSRKTNLLFELSQIDFNY